MIIVSLCGSSARVRQRRHNCCQLILVKPQQQQSKVKQIMHNKIKLNLWIFCFIAARDSRLNRASFSCELRQSSESRAKEPKSKSTTKGAKTTTTKSRIKENRINRLKRLLKCHKNRTTTTTTTTCRRLIGSKWERNEQAQTIRSGLEISGLERSAKFLLAYFK